MVENAMTSPLRICSIRKFCKLNYNLFLFFILSIIKLTHSAALASGSDDSSICAEYPRLSLCQLRPVLENALTEIDFLVNGIGILGSNDGLYTDIQNDDNSPSPRARTPSAVILQRKKKSPIHRFLVPMEKEVLSRLQSIARPQLAVINSRMDPFFRQRLFQQPYAIRSSPPISTTDASDENISPSSSSLLDNNK